MKKQLFVRNRRGAARRSVGLSLFVLISMSTLLGFTAQIISRPTAKAAETTDLTIEQNQEIRVLRYFKDCLQNYLRLEYSDDGFKGFREVFTDEGNQERIAVGPDLDPQNGVWTCQGVARRAISFMTDVGDEEAYLMKALWGTTYADNGGPVKAGRLVVGINAKRIINNVNAAIVRRENQGSSQRANLKRFGPLLTQCFKKWSDTPFEAALEKNQDDAIEYPGRKVYAERKEFDWKDIDSVTIRSVEQGKQYSLAGSNGYIGSIELNFQTKSGALSAGKFDDRESDWFPIGNDLGSSAVSSSYYKNHSGQSILDCNWVKKNNQYLFEQSHKWFFAVKDGKPYVSTKNANGEIEFVDEVATNTDGNLSDADEAQCIVNPPLGWILCPIITVGVATVGWLESQVTDALQFPPLSSDDNFVALYDTWSAFKNLANAALVLIFLVMIFAQVLPIEVDPYMAKKLLPRLIAAAIFIQFSYLFVQILVDITNVLAGGVSSIIGSISTGSNGGGFWGGGGANGASVFGSALAIAGGTAGIAAAASAGAALIVPVLLLLLSATISILTLFVTLEVRIVLIIVYTMVAPLAILAWVLPNTENYFKKWFTTLFKLLLMYPIIVFMVQGTGLIVNVAQDATAAIPNGGATSLIFNLLVSIIPIIIFFMIPATFKWAGGMFATVSGAIQSQGNRWSKQARSGSLMKNSLADARNKAGTKLMDTHGQKGFRRLGARVATGNAFSFGDAGRRKLKASQESAMHAVEESIQDTHRGKSNKDLLFEMDVLKKKGKVAQAAAIGNLIMAQGGGLEMAKYFESLEYEMEQSKDAHGNLEWDVDGDGNKTAKMVPAKDKKGEYIRKEGVVKRDKTGAVRGIEDEIWNHVAKKNGAALAVAAPHSIGKPISQAGPQAFLSSKGVAPAREFEIEVQAIQEDLKSSDVEVVKSAQGKLARIANTFVQTAQQDNAGEMQPDMVRAWKNVSSALSTTGVKVSVGGVDIGIDKFIDKQTTGGSLSKFVQGT